MPLEIELPKSLDENPTCLLCKKTVLPTDDVVLALRVPSSGEATFASVFHESCFNGMLHFSLDVPPAPSA